MGAVLVIILLLPVIFYVLYINGAMTVESKTYHFRMNAEMSEGRVSVQLLNKDRQPLFSLTPQNPEASVEVEEKERYYIIYKYESATGNYELTWE